MGMQSTLFSSRYRIRAKVTLLIFVFSAIIISTRILILKSLNSYTLTRARYFQVTECQVMLRETKARETYDDRRTRPAHAAGFLLALLRSIVATGRSAYMHIRIRCTRTDVRIFIYVKVYVYMYVTLCILTTRGLPYWLKKDEHLLRPEPELLLQLLLDYCR